MRRVPLGPLVVPLLAGCYVYQPLGGDLPEPVPGAMVALELNDQGRVGMERQVGTEVARIEGAVVSRSDTGYVMGVRTVIKLWGSQSRWQGEQISVRADYVRRMSERRLSPGRTVMAAGGATLGFVVYLLANTLVGGGNAPGPGPEPPPPGGN